MQIQLTFLTECFHYLDALRMSGITNMYGASPYLEEEMDLSKADAKSILSAWMESFDDIPAEERAKEFLNNNKIVIDKNA